MFPRSMKNLTMTRVVAKKANLTKDKGQVGGIAELKPEVVHNQEIGDARGQQAHCEKNLVCIISGLFVYSFRFVICCFNAAYSLTGGRLIESSNAPEFVTKVPGTTLSFKKPSFMAELHYSPTCSFYS